MDTARIQQFAGTLLGTITGGALTMLTYLGYRVGLFEAAAVGPGTCGELAERAGLHERYVREWLGAMVTAGFFTFDPADRRYTLPPEHAALLTGGGAANLAPMSSLVDSFAPILGELEGCFRHGGGIGYDRYRPKFTEGMDDQWRRIYDEQLITGFLAAVPGLGERLAAGATVLDIGCGTGHAINLMAREYPKSRFVGYDLAEDALARAETERAAMGLANASFARRDVAELDPPPSFEVITVFDAIHDQRAPDQVLRAIHRALAPDGVLVMVDFRFSSHLEDNLANPLAPMYYAMSLLHCVPVSLAEHGPGLGAVWGQQQARQMLTDAGFRSIDVLDTPRPQNCLYLCQP